MKGTLTGTPEKSIQQIEEHYNNILSFIRSRLNIIGTSAYLLQSSFSQQDSELSKYIHRIHNEIESIRKVLNI